MTKEQRIRQARREHLVAVRVANDLLYKNPKLNPMNRDAIALLMAEMYLKGKKNGAALGRAIVSRRYRG